MLDHIAAPTLPLPKHWRRGVRSAVLHVIALARMACGHASGWAVGCANPRVRRQAELDQVHREIALLREELRIKDARMDQIPAHRRPHYPPTDRMAILELKAARGWNQIQTAKAMLVTTATVAAWTRRVDEQGPEALVQLPEPVNRFPAFVGYVVRRLKTLCPSLGTVAMAKTLARAGLHLGATTAGRMLKERPPDGPMPETPTLASAHENDAEPVVTAKYPNHVWPVDLTAVPIVGFWVPWLPFALPQVWPFCWWVAVIIDHFSRRAMGAAVFKRPPTSQRITAFLRRTIRKAHATPKYLICDKAPQFWCDRFMAWCKGRGIHIRFGAVGRHGSIAVIERFIRSLKQEGLRKLLLSLCQRTFCQQVQSYAAWYNTHRPHTFLNGATPDERYFGRRPANRAPRFEPPARWPRGSPCATPQTLVKGWPGARLELVLTFEGGQKHLPVVALRRVA